MCPGALIDKTKTGISTPWSLYWETTCILDTNLHRSLFVISFRLGNPFHQSPSGLFSFWRTGTPLSSYWFIGIALAPNAIMERARKRPFSVPIAVWLPVGTGRNWSELHPVLFLIIFRLRIPVKPNFTDQAQ
jgi:hypothetical protein